MNVKILNINNCEIVEFMDFSRPIKLLCERGYDVKAVYTLASDEDIKSAVNLLKKDNSAILVCGNYNILLDLFKQDYELDVSLSTFNIEGIDYACCDTLSDIFIIDVVLPMLNTKSRTYYTTVIFKTFDKSEKELREILKDFIKNRNRIAFKFFPSLLECEVQIKYSSKMSKAVVDDIICGVAEALSDCTYSVKDMSISECVADLLKVRGKKLCIAESFTGGGIASSLIQYAGTSAFLNEGLVCYSNESKINRLKVDPIIIGRYGAVSIETVYEMAANMMLNSDCDVVVATSGNAGPTAEKEGERGLCFIAVGDRNGIHIYKYIFEGNRKDVINSGIKSALYKLYKLLKENEFQEMLKNQELL